MAMQKQSWTDVWAVLFALMLAELALCYEISMIFAALPRLSVVFGDHAKASWLVTGFMMVSAAAAAVGGRLGDLYGRRRVVQYALALAIAGSMLSAFSSDFYGVFIGRTIQGCAACVLPLCIALVRETLPASRVASGVGLMLASAAIGTGGGMLLGGYIVDHHDWPSLFYVSGALALLGLLAVSAWVPQSVGVQQNERFDVLGGLLFVPGLGAILYALYGLKEASFSGTWLLLVGGVGAVCLAVWYVYEYRHRSPLIDVRTVFRGPVGLANLAMLLIALSVFQVSLVGSLLLQQPIETGVGFGKSATYFGLVQMPGLLLGVAASPFAGYLASRWGAGRVLMYACLVNSLSWLALALLPGQLWLVVTAIAIIGTMGAAMLTCIPNLIIEHADEVRTGELVGFAIVVRNLGGGVGAQIVVLLLMLTTVSLDGSTRAYPSLTAYQILFGLFATVGLLAAAITSRSCRQSANAMSAASQGAQS